MHSTGEIESTFPDTPSSGGDEITGTWVTSTKDCDNPFWGSPESPGVIISGTYYSDSTESGSRVPIEGEVGDLIDRHFAPLVPLFWADLTTSIENKRTQDSSCLRLQRVPCGVGIESRG